MKIQPPNEKNTTRIFFHSEKLTRLDYEIIKEHLVIFGYSNGQMSIDLKVLGILIEELTAIKEVWADAHD